MRELKKSELNDSFILSKYLIMVSVFDELAIVTLLSGITIAVILIISLTMACILFSGLCIESYE